MAGGAIIKRGCPKSLQKYDFVIHFAKVQDFDKLYFSDNQQLLITL